MVKRWNERMSDLFNAIERLKEAIGDYEEYKLDSLKDSVIQRFEFSLELSWKAIKRYLNSEGVIEATTPKQTIREAYLQGIIGNGEIWMNMLDDRNITSHTYDKKIADKIFENIVKEYSLELENNYKFLIKKEVF